MDWNELNDIEQIDSILELSKESPVMLFKHSTRCSISSMAKNRLERNWDSNTTVIPYYLDLIAHRDISNELAVKFNVEHQSPQALLIKDGVCIYDASHQMISVNSINASL